MTDPHSSSSVSLQYSIVPPAGSTPPPNVPAQHSHSVPIQLPLSSRQGAPSSSRESDTVYLSALADAVDEIKGRVMADMSAWKDAVGRYEDAEARRAGSRPTQTNQANRRGEDAEDDDEEDEEDDEEEE